MNSTMKNRVTACVLVLIVVALGIVFASDVTVQHGDLDVDDDLDVGGDADVWGDLEVHGGDLDVYGFYRRIGYNTDPDAYFDDVWLDYGHHLTVGGHIAADYYVDVGTDLEVDDRIGYYSKPDAYFDDVDVDDDLEADGYVDAWYWLWADDCLEVEGDTLLWGEVDITDDVLVYGQFKVIGKVESTGGYDPPYVLYDQQSRAQVIDRIKKEVPPEKQSGAAMFFNKDTKRLETYVAGEGRFYDLQGNLIYSLSKVEQPTTQYQTQYYLDYSTGQIETLQKPIYDRYEIKSGFALDKNTGRLSNKSTGEAASQEEALELYVASEGNFYDLGGKLVRSEPKDQVLEYETEYHLDRSTGEIRTRHKTVRDRYIIKEGIDLDKKTGKFISRETGDEVQKEEALELYVQSEGKYYDLDDNFLRSEPKEEEIEYETEYYLDRSTGEVKPKRMAIRERYVIKKGIDLDSKTGQFIDSATGEEVPKETAIELKKD